MEIGDKVEVVEPTRCYEGCWIDAKDYEGDVGCVVDITDDMLFVVDFDGERMDFYKEELTKIVNTDKYFFKKYERS